VTRKKLTVAERKLHDAIDDVQFNIDKIHESNKRDETKIKALMKKRRALMDRLERK
jgi:prefoldin subunit 5